jgi:membrane fusion protein, multidrug efflux system
MNRRDQAVTFLVVVSFAASGGLSSCSNERRTQAAPPETVSNVAVIVTQKTTVPDWQEAIGTVRAAQTSQVASQTVGNITEIRVHEGDRVVSGQILATIDDSQPRSAVEQASAAANAAEREVAAADSSFVLAEATLKRYQPLYEKKSVSPQEFDEIKARYQSAEARRDMARAGQAQANAALTQARTSLGYTQVRAPFAGMVTEKKVDVGTLASPGLPIFSMEDTRSYRLEAAVDESDIRIVRVGQSVPVLLDALGNTELSGKVAQIVPAADAASRSFLVKIQLRADARLRSGLFGRARFSRGERSALMVPLTAILERGQLQGVNVVSTNGIAELRYVTLGKTAGQQVEVLSGLQDGEKVVAAPGDRELGGKQIALHP